jgi:hypothetical protein
MFLDRFLFSYEVSMDTETLQHLVALREVNKALIDGLKAAVYFLDKLEQISEKQ